MNRAKLLTAAAIALAVTIVLYDIDLKFDVVLPGESVVPDSEAEAAFQRCFREKDDEIHTTAFGTIDNPDVQKEFITSSRARAERECRAMHPEATITVPEPLRFDIVDLTPRFW